MRSLLIFLLLLPSVAHAEPVSSAIFTWLASSGVAVGTATAIASFVTRALTAVVTTLANQMLQKKVGINDRGIQTEQTTTGDVTPQKFVVGRYAVEGHAVAPAYSHGKNNRYLTYIIEVSNLPVVGLSERVAINGNWTAIDTTPANQHAEYGSPLTGLQNEGEDRGWIRFYDGTQATADAMLVDKYSTHPNRPWTTDHVLEGSAYAVLTFLFDREVFSGLPSVRFEIDGIRLYDPREDSTVGGSGVQRWSNPATWTFTKNPQVINYNILRGITLATGDVYGGQVPASDLPLDSWFAAMNECDELIGDRVQFEAGFEIDVSIEPLQIITEMNRASFAQISEFGGIFRPRVGAPASPVLSLTDGDILITRAADLTPFPGLAKTNNAITGTYVEPNDLYQGRSSDPIYNTTWEADDGGRRLTMDMGLPAVVNKSQCQHLLNSYVRDNRRFITHRLPLPPSFAALEPLDTISWTSAQNGYTSKVFEVVEIEDQLTTLVQMVVVREREAGDVAWSSGQDVPSPTDRTGIPTPDLIGVSLAVAEAVRFFRNEAQTVVVLTTSVTDDGVVDQIEVEYKRSADSDWIPLGRGGVGEFIVPDLIPATYDFRARPITTSGLPGPWDTETGFTVDFLEDYRSVWNGRFASGDFTGWQLEIYDGSLGGFDEVSELTVVQRNAGASEDAIRYAPTPNVVQIDWGDNATGIGAYNRLIWSGLIPVQPGADVYASFRYAAGDGSTYSGVGANGCTVRATLRWYDEDGVQLSAPDDETDDYFSTAIAPLPGDGFWKIWQRSAIPPAQAAFCRPVLEAYRGIGLAFVADMEVDVALNTARITRDGITEEAETAVSAVSLAVNNVEETVVTETAIVPEISSGTTGEALTIDAAVSGNVDFTSAGEVTIRLYIDGVNVASGKLSSDGPFSLSAISQKTAGEYDVELRASSPDVTAFSFTEARARALVLKR